LRAYLKDKAVEPEHRIFPITYAAARIIVKEAGKLAGIKLRPHDLRRHAATYASRSGVPIEIVSKVILRHSDLSTTQWYLGKISDSEATRWIENLYGYLENRFRVARSGLRVQKIQPTFSWFTGAASE
jgi:integrase